MRKLILLPVVAIFLLTVPLLVLNLRAQPKDMYLASKKFKEYHRLSCKLAVKIESKDLIFLGGKEEAKKGGYAPCKRCRPDDEAYDFMDVFNPGEYEELGCSGDTLESFYRKAFILKFRFTAQNQKLPEFVINPTGDTLRAMMKWYLETEFQTELPDSISTKKVMEVIFDEIYLVPWIDSLYNMALDPELDMASYFGIKHDLGSVRRKVLREMVESERRRQAIRLMEKMAQPKE